MRAIITRHVNNLDNDRRSLAQAFSTDDLDVRVLSQYAEAIGMPARGEGPGNILYANCPGAFDTMAIGPSVQLFADPWGRAFLRHCARMMKPEGTLAVPFSDPRRADAGGAWSLEALESFLRPQAVTRAGGIGHFAQPEPPNVRESILDWFTRHALGNITFDLLSRYIGTVAASGEVGKRLEVMTYGGDAGASGPVQAVARMIGADLDAEMARAVRAQSYYVAGIAYKARLLKHILRHHLDERADLRLIDVGGGYGLLMAEMLLDPGLGVAKAVTQDLQEQNRLLALNMFTQLQAELAGRFFFSLGRAEEFTFAESFHAISFIGSLLYVPRDAREATLRRCWDALETGGVLIVHENIKAPSYTRDYEVMFTVNEIDDLLGRFGEVHRYLSTATRAVTQRQAAEKTVFRVVQKA